MRLRRTFLDRFCDFHAGGRFPASAADQAFGVAAKVRRNISTNALGCR
jgi:hypothetical protein